MMFTESRLIKRVKEKGDKEAASELIHKYYKDVYTYVFRQTKNEELSKDLTQDIFIAVLKSIVTFEGKKASFKTWVYKIASNKIIDYYRSKHYKYSNLLDEIESYDFASKYDLQEEFQLKEDVAEVMEVVNGLNSNLQQIIRLKVFGDLTFRDIGKLLDISESTAKTRYYSSIKKVQKALEVKENEK